MSVIENRTVFELLGVTLFSVYVQICFTAWMPAICNFPYWFHIIVQFAFIGLPQAAIIIIPQYLLKFYSLFSLFGAIGLLCSYLRFVSTYIVIYFCFTFIYSLLSIRFKNVEQKILDKHANDDEGLKLLSKNSKNDFLMEHFDTKPDQMSTRSNTISMYQTCIMIMTITAISAVDFKAFPARFRKSKAFGLSLVKKFF